MARFELRDGTANMHPAYEVVRKFEQAVAEFAGAPAAVAVDSCTSALFLCCRLLDVAEVSIPRHTFFSVPASILHAGGTVTFRDEAWTGAYRLLPYPIVDSACRFRRNMYEPGTLWCLSFDKRKHLPVGRGGMILTDDPEAAHWLRLARYHGRGEEPRMTAVPQFAGWKAHMYPEEAARGMELLMHVADESPDLQLEYPDLSGMAAYRREPQDGRGGDFSHVESNGADTRSVPPDT